MNKIISLLFFFLFLSNVPVVTEAASVHCHEIKRFCTVENLKPDEKIKVDEFHVFGPVVVGLRIEAAPLKMDAELSVCWEAWPNPCGHAYHAGVAGDEARQRASPFGGWMHCFIKNTSKKILKTVYLRCYVK